MGSHAPSDRDTHIVQLVHLLFGDLAAEVHDAPWASFVLIWLPTWKHERKLRIFLVGFVNSSDLKARAVDCLMQYPGDK
jgi:hypothetical protein